MTVRTKNRPHVCKTSAFLLTIITDGTARPTKAIVSCTTCKKNGHTSDKCWCGAETKFRNVVKHIAEAEMVLKTTKSTAAEKRAQFLVSLLLNSIAMILAPSCLGPLAVAMP